MDAPQNSAQPEEVERLRQALYEITLVFTYSDGDLAMPTDSDVQYYGNRLFWASERARDGLNNTHDAIRPPT